MTAIFDGFRSSRRRPSRSRSESGKQLHARWGDAAITAPQGGGWIQQSFEDDIDKFFYQTHGSPDSQKTLVNNSPNLTLESDRLEKSSIIEEAKPTCIPFIQKERSAITITIPLPWSRRSHRRSSSTSSHQAQATPIAAEPRPALSKVVTNMDQVVVADPRSVAESRQSESPIVNTASPIYNDVSTVFTRVAFPDKGYGPGRLPPLQTSLPPNKIQPASALSDLSPVAEKYDGFSESNNATPLDNTPIGGYNRETPKLVPHNGLIQGEDLATQLEIYSRPSPPSLPTSRLASREASDPDFERASSRRTAKESWRPSSRGPGLGEVAYMRASSREPVERPRGESREAVDERPSASRESISRRAGSREPVRRRAISREPGRRSTSPAPTSRRAFSRPATHRADSPDPISRRAFSRDRAYRRADSPNPLSPRALSREPVFRLANSPDKTSRRAFSQDSAGRRPISPDGATQRHPSRGPGHNRSKVHATFAYRAHSPEPPHRSSISPGPMTRRAMSREPFTRQRTYGDFARRAASVDPIRSRASPREDVLLSYNLGSPAITAPGEKPPSSAGLSADSLTASDEATDFETETDELYFESRKGWNGPAVEGAESKGFYAAVVRDYKAIARDVEAEMVPAGDVMSVGASIVNLVVSKKEKEGAKVNKVYGGPDLVPSQEELWG